MLAKIEAQHERLICNLSCFALQSGNAGGSQGERLGSFSFAITLWNDKEMASLAVQRSAQLCARQKEKLFEI